MKNREANRDGIGNTSMNNQTTRDNTKTCGYGCGSHGNSQATIDIIDHSYGSICIHDKGICWFE